MANKQVWFRGSMTRNKNYIYVTYERWIGPHWILLDVVYPRILAKDVEEAKRQAAANPLRMTLTLKSPHSPSFTMLKVTDVGSKEQRPMPSEPHPAVGRGLKQCEVDVSPEGCDVRMMMKYAKDWASAQLESSSEQLLRDLGMLAFTLVPGR